MSSPLDENAMNQLQSQQSELLDKIDELRAIGVGGLVELPQIIVCGNQSSGKSSVLEAISRVRFPAKSNVCTRFATEVVLRRSPRDKISVSIEPGSSRTNEKERQKLRDFTSGTFSSSGDLPTLIDLAKECMGLSSADSPNSGFSDDVLKVEISSPEQPDLTLVDLPGLYYSHSSEQSEEGRVIVQRLTEKYMKSSRSIILAVISARADYHIQQVLNIAQTFDPNYERALGVVTQPDILEAGSDEEENYLQYIKNEKVKLQLGWHVLRNRSFETRNISDDERDVQEMDFFEKGKWTSLSREQVGVESLRRRLSSILLIHVRRNLPGLIADIKERTLQNEQALAKMGTSRATLHEQRHFLINISSRFARITNQALNGAYTDGFFGGFQDQSTSTGEFAFRRLRAVIRELNEHFAEAMDVRGSRDIILQGFVDELSPWQLEQARLKPYMDGWTPSYISPGDLENEIKKLARESRGLELPGSPNPLLVGLMFRHQCEPWESIAKSHIMNSWDSVQYFIQLVLRDITDDHTRPLLMRHLISPELEGMKEILLKKLDELTSYIKSGHPLPVGNSFLSKIKESREKRQLDALKENLGFRKQFFSEDVLEKTINANDLERAASGLQSSSDQFAVTEVVAQMQAYYDTAIVTFIDNVAILAIENCLLRPLEHIFTGQTVLDLDDNRICKIAAEPVSTQRDRERLTGELEKLRKGRQALSAFSADGSSLRAPPILADQDTLSPGQAVSQTSTPVSRTKTGNVRSKVESRGSTRAPESKTPRLGLFPQPSSTTAGLSSVSPAVTSNQNGSSNKPYDTFRFPGQIIEPSYTHENKSSSSLFGNPQLPQNADFSQSPFGKPSTGLFGTSSTSTFGKPATSLLGKSVNPVGPEHGTSFPSTKGKENGQN